VDEDVVPLAQHDTIVARLEERLKQLEFQLKEKEKPKALVDRVMNCFSWSLHEGFACCLYTCIVVSAIVGVWSISFAFGWGYWWAEHNGIGRIGHGIANVVTFFYDLFMNLKPTRAPKVFDSNAKPPPPPQEPGLGQAIPGMPVPPKAPTVGNDPFVSPAKKPPSPGERRDL
jgi:hypothetical protein